jgi:hypothetical protein
MVVHWVRSPFPSQPVGVIHVFSSWFVSCINASVRLPERIDRVCGLSVFEGESISTEVEGKAGSSNESIRDRRSRFLPFGAICCSRIETSHESSRKADLSDQSGPGRRNAEAGGNGGDKSIVHLAK